MLGPHIFFIFFCSHLCLAKSFIHHACFIFFIIYIFHHMYFLSYIFFIIYIFHHIYFSSYIFFIIYIFHHLYFSSFIFFIIYIIHHLYLSSTDPEKTCQRIQDFTRKICITEKRDRIVIDRVGSVHPLALFPNSCNCSGVTTYCYGENYSIDTQQMPPFPVGLLSSANTQIIKWFCY